MPDQDPKTRKVRRVTTDDPDYIAYLWRLREQRPNRTGKRHMGEYLGGLVEQATRHWLSQFVPLSEARIVGWEQRLRNQRMGQMFREVDAIWEIDEESLCLYEMKFTYAERMMVGTGLSQLSASSELLFTDPRYQYILLRLIYISEEPVAVFSRGTEVPVVEPNDEYEAVGVIWITMDQVETAAQELGIELPENWRDPATRENYMEDPDWEAFQQQQAEVQETQTYNPLEEALRRALGSEEADA